MTELTIASLAEQVKALQETVEKQRKMLASTAEQILRLQMSSAQKDINAIPSPADAIGGTEAGLDTSDFATNDDLVQLVGELQGQLTILDDKSLIRTTNSHVAEETDELTPLPNFDGVLPTDFPKTVAEFQCLDDDMTVELSRFYELVPLTVEEQARWELYLNGEAKSPELGDDEKLIGAEGLDEDVVQSLWLQLAKFLGVSHLKKDV